MAPGQLDERLSDAVTAQPTVVTDDDAAVAGIDEKAGPQIAADQHSDSLSKDAENNGTRVLYSLVNANGDEEAVSEDDPRVRDIPPYVRRIVGFKDDTTEPTLTFRYFLLTILFVAPGAFLSQMAHFRTTYAPYSVFFVQIASNYVGVWLAKVLPARRVRIPFTRHGFSLNPGPFSTKEHVLVTISAASGATYNLGYTPISMSELYFGERVNGGRGRLLHAGDYVDGVLVRGAGEAVSHLRSAVPLVSSVRVSPHVPNSSYWKNGNHADTRDANHSSARRHSSRRKRSSARIRRRSPRKQMRVFFGVLVGRHPVAVPPRVRLPHARVAGVPVLGGGRAAPWPTLSARASAAWASSTCRWTGPASPRARACS
ncbi:OPT super [Metarhizium acridum]|nr:OPT super [Metarhizium acridum]